MQKPRGGKTETKPGSHFFQKWAGSPMLAQRQKNKFPPHRKLLFSMASKQKKTLFWIVDMGKFEKKRLQWIFFTARGAAGKNFTAFLANTVFVLWLLFFTAHSWDWKTETFAALEDLQYRQHRWRRLRRKEKEKYNETVLMPTTRNRRIDSSLVKELSWLMKMLQRPAHLQIGANFATWRISHHVQGETHPPEN